MREILIAIMASVLAIVTASAAHAGFALSGLLTPVDGTGQQQYRITLFALATGTSKNVAGGDLSLHASFANAIKFNIVHTGDADDDLLTAPLTTSPSSLLNVTGTRFNREVFRTLDPGYPQPENTSPNGPINAGVAAYQAGMQDYRLAGRDARTVPVGTLPGSPADASINSGRGAAIVSAVVMSPSSLHFVGTLLDDQFNSYPADMNVIVDIFPEPTAALLFTGVVAGITRRFRR